MRASTRADAELIRAADDDADAFAELYDRYARDAVAWARRGGVHESDVVDVVAELFAQAWRSRRRFRDPGDGGAGAWLHGFERALAPHRAGHYPNLVEEPADASAFFAPGVWARLREIKARYDADDLFKGNHHIPPAR